MIAISYRPGMADGRVILAAAVVLANGRPLGTVSQLADGSGWRAVTDTGRPLRGLHRKRSEAGDALVDDSGIIDR